MRADLSLQQAPPYSVPARFLVSAPLFGLTAALLLLWFGPEVIEHRWTPQILAVTHLLTLGFLAMSMLGALMQLIPVLMGIIIPAATAFSATIHSTLVFGSLSLALAWLTATPQLFVAAMIALGISFGFFILLAGERLIRSANRHVTRSMMLASLLALAVTACLGIYLALGHSVQRIPLARQLTDTHLVWGMTGWVFMLVCAVAYQVIPMFQITDEYPQRLQRWLWLAVIIALLCLSVNQLNQAQALRLLAVVLLAACLSAFSISTLVILHRRRRQLADTTLRFWQLAMSSLLLLLLTYSIPLLLDRELPMILIGLLMIHGFAMSAINGMMYKIIPFIIWLHLSARNKTLRDEGRRQSQVKVPHMRKVIPEAASMWQFRCHLASLVLMALATQWPQWLFYPAVLTFAVAQAFLFINLLKATLLYNSKLRQLKEKL